VCNGNQKTLVTIQHTPTIKERPKCFGHPKGKVKVIFPEILVAIQEIATIHWKLIFLVTKKGGMLYFLKIIR
jgi:hypothetical protein